MCNSLYSLTSNTLFFQGFNNILTEFQMYKGNISSRLIHFLPNEPAIDKANINSVKENGFIPLIVFVIRRTL